MSHYANFQYEDPYNYHTLQRNETMQLNTINRQDVGFPKFQTQAVKDFNLRTDDLRGSQPKGEYPYQSKITYANRSDDIKGAQPRKSIIDNRDPQYYDNTLRIDDIQGTRPNAMQFKTNRIGNNPLEPVYQLSQVQVIPPEPPKFLRNTLDISDIEGTKPKKDTSFIPKRNPIQYEEIPGTRPRKQFIPKNVHQSLDVKDINQARIWNTTRVTNPLDPVYKIYDDNNKLIPNYGKVDKSEPKILHKTYQNAPNFAYSNSDIDGSQAYSLQNKFLMTEQRKDYRQINNVQDINGAQVNSVKKGILTQRNINPLMPKYQIPGNSEENTYFGQKTFEKQNNRYQQNNQQYQQQQQQFQPYQQASNNNQQVNINQSAFQSVDLGRGNIQQQQQQQQQFNQSYLQNNGQQQQQQQIYQSAIQQSAQNLVGNGGNQNYQQQSRYY